MFHLISLVCCAFLFLGCDDAPAATANDASAAEDVEIAFDLPAAIDIFERPDVVVRDVGADTVDSCPAGQTLCGADCIDTNVEPHHCGDCQTDCTMLLGVNPAGSVACRAGRCDLTGACQRDRANCDENTSNGCEVDLSTSSNCGSCGARCAEPTPMCAMATNEDGGGPSYRCANNCLGLTPTRCDAMCVDTMSNLQHCGGCGHACTSAPINASPICSSGVCNFVCNMGFHACGDGCVSNTSVASCGSSCTPCPTPANGTATCNGTSCGITCNPGYHPCGGSCVSNTSVETCGTSCTPCMGIPSNSQRSCDGTACGFTCNTGFHRCDGICQSNTSLDACGTSCVSCPGVSNAVRTCDGTACGFRCLAGHGDCNGRVEDGCETDTSGDVNNCGVCGHVCSTPAHSTPGCFSRVCNAACEFGYLDCDGTLTNGCESHVTDCYSESDLFYEGFESAPTAWTLDPVWSWRFLVYPSARGYGHLLAQYASSACRQEGTATIAQEFDLSTAVSFTLTYYSEASFGRLDTHAVEVSTDGGSSWAPYDDAPLPLSWAMRRVNLNAYSGMPHVRVRFHYLDVCGDGVNATWRLDEVLLHARVRNF